VVVICGVETSRKYYAANIQDCVYVGFNGKSDNDCLTPEKLCESILRALQIVENIQTSTNKVHIVIVDYHQSNGSRLFKDVCLDGIVSGRESKSFLFMRPVSSENTQTTIGFFSFSGDCAMHNIDLNLPNNLSEGHCLFYSCGDALTLQYIKLFAESKTQKTKASLIMVCRGSLTIQDCNFSFILFYSLCFFFFTRHEIYI
jgi:hypothetical protein